MFFFFFILLLLQLERAKRRGCIFIWHTLSLSPINKTTFSLSLSLSLPQVTPDKYETIRDKILAVGIDAPKTLGGLINLVFDKALRDVTFCEIYAALCFDLNAALPEFPAEAPAEGEGEGAAQPAITFRRLLISKCQVEFEQGTQAIAAVEAREKQAAADRAAGKKTDEEEEAVDEEEEEEEEEGEAAAAAAKKEEEANGEKKDEEKEKEASSSTADAAAKPAADADKGEKEEGELAETAPAPAAPASTGEQRAAPKFIAVDEAKLAAKAAAAEARAKRLAEARG